MQAPTDNLRGALFMTAAMAGFAVEDMILKFAAAAGLPVGQILILFGLAGLAGFAVLARRAGQSLVPRDLTSPAMLVRAGFEVTGRLFYTLAFILTPLSSASAILQAAPLAVIAGAALIFGERVTARRWAAVTAGFVGVMIILRPGTDGFSWASLLAVLGTIGFVGRDLATRAAPRTLSTWQLGVAGFAMMIPAGAALLAFTGGAIWPGPAALGLILVAAGVGILAYSCLTLAMRTGEIGAVTPFRYTRLLFALALGVLVFGERPDAWTLAGAALVVLAGLTALAPRPAR
jgi:drug/metabolite transporter (DMT)-like permease